MDQDGKRFQSISFLPGWKWSVARSSATVWVWPLPLPANLAAGSSCYGESRGGDPCFGRGVPSLSSACGMPQPPAQTATNLLLVRQVVVPLVINSVSGELISGTLEISLLGIQAINISAAPPGAVQKGTVWGMLQLAKQCSLYAGASVRLREAIKPLHWKVVVIFHQNIFLIEKNCFDLLEKIMWWASALVYFFFPFSFWLKPK